MPKGYSLTQIRLHWVTTALIIVQSVFGHAMTEDWEAWHRDPQIRITAMELSHVTLGLLTLALVLWRLALRLVHGVPPMPTAENPVLAVLARLSHFGLYAVVLLACFTGALAWFADSIVAATAHRVVQVLLYMVVGLHVAASMLHQFVLRDGLLRRILRPED